MQKIITCLGFDHQAEEAITFYSSVIPNSKMLSQTRYGDKRGIVANGEPRSRGGGASAGTRDPEINRWPRTSVRTRSAVAPGG